MVQNKIFNKRNISIIVLLTCVGIFFFWKYKEKTESINPQELEKAKQQYLNNFYTDESMISTGKLFDIRYIHYDGLELSNSAIEIVQKGNVSIFDVDTKIILTNGEKIDIYFNTQASPQDYTANQFFGDAKIYHPRFDRINVKEKQEAIYYHIDEEVIDFTNFTIEISYRGEIESHDLVYDEDKARKVLIDFFDNYFTNEIKYNRATELWLLRYYENYSNQLRKEGTEEVQEFAYKVWKVYIENKEYDKENILFSSILSDYCDEYNITEDNVKYQMGKLRDIVYESEEYINYSKGARRDALISISSIINIAENYDGDINEKERQKDFFEIDAENPEKEDFWGYVDKYLK